MVQCNGQILITESAAEFIKKLIVANNIPQNFSFRIKCKGAIGEPFEYSFGFDSVKTDNDILVEQKGISAFIDSDSYQNLKNSIINYSEKEENLKIANPNEMKKCSGNCKTHSYKNGVK